MAGYTVTQVSANVYQITDNTAGRDGVDTLTNIANVTFTDGTFALGSLVVIPPAVINGTANADTLTGTSASETINGLGGNDTIDGGAGTDTLVGGAGNDTYIVDSTTDIITEVAGEGADTVQSSVSVAALAANVENLTLTGSAAIGVGNSLDNVITGNAAANTLTGGAGSDSIIGGGGGDTVVMSGAKAGYTVTQVSANVYQITDNTAGRDGVDTLTNIANVTFSDGTYGVGSLVVVPPSVINGTASADVLTGTSASDTFNGGGGNDTIEGGGGNDTVVMTGAKSGYTVTKLAANVYQIEDKTAGRDGIDTLTDITNVTYSDGTFSLAGLVVIPPAVINGTANADALTGTTASETINGLAGNDTIDGAAGTDTLVGGAGNDTYVVDSTTDTITEVAGEGTDTLQSSVSVAVLADNVENLTLTGAAASGIGNSLANVITGNASANTLAGGAGDDSIMGGGGVDVAVMSGAKADYTVTQISANVYQITDTTVGRDGVDTLTDITNVTFSDGTFSLSGLVVIPPSVIAGTAGADLLAGTSGSDTFNGGAGDDSITGGGGTDATVMSGAKADYMVTQLSANVYQITDTTSGRDGIDTLTDITSVTFSDGTFALSGLVAVPTTDISGTANAEAVAGTSASEKIYGLAGNDTIDAGAGADTMYGGVGNDIYIFDGTGDRAVEVTGEGIDRVKSSVSVKLAANVENLTLTGTLAINGSGNALGNQITGNSAGNIITGGWGRDVTTGGAGRDTFDFNGIKDSLAGTATRDTITDFRHLFDKIDLSTIDASSKTAGNGAFTFLGKAAFTHHAGELHVTTTTASTLISGDVNGDGVADFQIMLKGALTLTAADFVL